MVDFAAAAAAGAGAHAAAGSGRGGRRGGNRPEVVVDREQPALSVGRPFLEVVKIWASADSIATMPSRKRITTWDLAPQVKLNFPSERLSAFGSRFLPCIQTRGKHADSRRTCRFHVFLKHS